MLAVIVVNVQIMGALRVAIHAGRLSSGQYVSLLRDSLHRQIAQSTHHGVTDALKSTDFCVQLVCAEVFIMCLSRKLAVKLKTG